MRKYRWYHMDNFLTKQLYTLKDDGDKKPKRSEDPMKKGPQSIKNGSLDTTDKADIHIETGFPKPRACSIFDLCRALVPIFAYIKCCKPRNRAERGLDVA